MLQRVISETVKNHDKPSSLSICKQLLCRQPNKMIHGDTVQLVRVHSKWAPFAGPTALSYTLVTPQEL